MGQKVNPNGLRLGINKDWAAKWYANKIDFSTLLGKDLKIRKYLSTKLVNAGISKVDIERTTKQTNVVIYTSKPGVMIGHGGEEIEKLKADGITIITNNYYGQEIRHLHFHIIPRYKNDNFTIFCFRYFSSYNNFTSSYIKYSYYRE